MSADGPEIEVEHFDGRSARSQPVRLRISGERLLIAGNGVARSVPLADIAWPERTRHGARVAHLKDGSALHCQDGPAWDAWTRASGRGESLVVRAQQNWRGVAIAALMMGVLLAATYVWGLPLMSRAVVAMLPESFDQSLGEVALDSIDDAMLAPSALPAAEQDRVQGDFARAVALAFPQGAPAHRLLFRKGQDDSLGPNAFALPGGAIVLTDELVSFLKDNPGAVTGVLAHELGHVRHRHGMRALVQATALTAIASLAFGDFSSLLAGVPVLLGQAGYSRDAEREADAESVRIMRAAGISPAVMVAFFEKIAAERDRKGKGATDHWLGIAIASHPADADRIRFFREAAAQR